MPTLNLGRVGFVNKGAWSVATAYKINDVVTHNNGTYAALQAHTGQTPVAGGSAYWQEWITSDNATFVGNAINNATAKTTPADADLIGLVDSAASFVLKKLAWANLKAAIVSQLSSTMSTKPNILINPHFDINQRGYVSGTATTISNQYTFDRWRIPTLGESITFSTSGGVTTITLPASGLEQVIEPTFIKGGSYYLTVNGTASTITVSQSVDNVTYNTVTPSSGAYTITANYYVKINLKSGNVTSVKFEEGTVSTPIAKTDDMFRAKRYFDYGSVGSGRYWAGSAASTYFAGAFKLTNVMRTAPTITTTTPTYVNSSTIVSGSSVTDVRFSVTTAAIGVYSASFTWYADSEIY